MRRQEGPFNATAPAHAKRVRVGPTAAAVRPPLHVELADELERLDRPALPAEEACPNEPPEVAAAPEYPPGFPPANCTTIRELPWLPCEWFDGPRRRAARGEPPLYKGRDDEVDVQYVQHV